MTKAQSGPPACVICHAPRCKRLFHAGDARHEYRCSACGTFFYWPLPTPEEQKAFYDAQWARDDSEYRGHYCNPEYEEENRRLSFIPRLELLKTRGFQGRILDIGCSVGTFLETARDAGWQAEGLDLGEEACRRTAERTGCPVHCGTIETAGLPAGAYDVIHASQVVEHVLDPEAFLRAIHRLLKPGGALLIATPVIEPVIYRTTHLVQKWLVPVVSRGRERAYPWAVHYPFHVIIFTPASLHMLLARTGFEVIRHEIFPWRAFTGMNKKWRVFYHTMNTLFRLFGTGMNIDTLAVKK